jgi:hypothetical protein
MFCFHYIYTNKILKLLFSITAIQNCNQELCQAKLYSRQATHNPKTANICYKFLQSDSSRLYRKYSSTHGIDVTQPPQYNVHNWLNPNSPAYKADLADAVFYYRAWTNQEEHFCLCIQTAEMKEAVWKYAHQKQLILDGTFGMCDSCILLFIALGVDVAGKSVPLAFFLFSAPTGSHATHAGYDTAILHELIGAWKVSLGSRNGIAFTPHVAITDMDTNECAALSLVWPDICLILCKFHICQCWMN